MELLSKVKILRYFFIFLASSFFYHPGESMQPDAPAYAPAYDQISGGASCRGITSGTLQAYKERMDALCLKAFATLSEIGYNFCIGWQSAECRKISNTYECSALVPVPGPRGMMETRTLDSCKPSLPPPRVTHMMTCFTGAGQTSGSKKKRRSPPALDAEPSKRFRFTGPPYAHPRPSFGPGAPPYTVGFPVSTSSSSIPSSSQRATSSFDVTQIGRLGITKDDLQSFAIPSQVPQGPNQGQVQGYSPGQAAGKPSLSEALSRFAVYSGPVQCDQCTQKFRSPMALYDHMFYHKGQTKCESCGIVYSNRSEFNDHWNTKHKAELGLLPQVYECNECPRKYVNLESLIKHMPYHTDQTLCQFCNNGYHFGSIDSLRSHIRSFHPQHWSPQNVWMNLMGPKGKK